MARSKVVWVSCVFIALLSVLVVACSPAPVQGDAVNGRRIYFGEVAVTGSRGEIMPCARCHPVNEGEQPSMPIGINLHDIGDRAGSVVPGQSAEDYLRTSILDPDAHLAGNFQDGLMSREYPQALTDQQVSDLVAYMLTLKK
jgi:cytochrome c553